MLDPEHQKVIDNVCLMHSSLALRYRCFSTEKAVFNL